MSGPPNCNSCQFRNKPTTISSFIEHQRLQAIYEVFNNKDHPMWQEKTEVFDFYNENFEFILKLASNINKRSL